MGFRTATRGDEAKLARWLAEEIARSEPSDEAAHRGAVGAVPGGTDRPPGRIDRIGAGARATAADTFCARTVDRLGPEVAARLEALLDEDTPPASGRGVLADLKADPARVSLASLLGEIDKLGRVRSLGLPADLFADVPDVMVSAWRARAAVEYRSSGLGGRR